MKWIATIAICTLSRLCAQEWAEGETSKPLPKMEAVAGSDFKYVKITDQWGIFPGAGLGYRWHKIHGFDLNLTAYSYWDAGYAFYAKGQYLFYPWQKGLYLGIGAGVTGGTFSIFKNHYNPFLNLTAESTIGYEWGKKTPMFLQFEIGGIPRGILLPALSFGFGF